MAALMISLFLISITSASKDSGSESYYSISTFVVSGLLNISANLFWANVSWTCSLSDSKLLFGEGKFESKIVDSSGDLLKFYSSLLLIFSS